jgi:hypothetical protein
MLSIRGLGQKPPNNKKYKLMFFCFIFICLLCLCLTVWICKIFFIFYNMIQDFFNLCILIHLFLKHEDIINNWSICLRIIITLIKESKNKNKVVLSLKKIITIKKTKWVNNSQASTLTYFSTCPFGQLTKKSTCLTQSFSCPKKLLKKTKTRE